MEILKEPGRVTGLTKSEEKKKIRGTEPGSNFDPVLGKVNKINPSLLEKDKDRDEEKTGKEKDEIQSEIKRSPRNVEGEMECSY